MGAGWRRRKEKVKQKLPWGADSSFSPTPNTRNELMLQEAGDFATLLTKLQKDITGLRNATEALLMTSKAVVSAQLPRVYEETSGGKVVPQNASQGAGLVVLPIGGTDFNAEELVKIAKETGKKLDAEGRNMKLENLRLEVDSRRRTVAEQGKKVDQQRARLPQTRTKGEYEMENTIKVLQHKESKLSACRQSFKEHEALVYHQLTNLIRDTVWLKSYLSAVLRLECEALQAANLALGQTKAAAMLPAPGGDMGVPVMASIPSTPDGIGAGRDAMPPHPQAHVHDISCKLQRARLKEDDGLVAISAASGGLKDSLYTIQDAPAAPTARIPAAKPVYDRYGAQGHGRDSMPVW